MSSASPAMADGRMMSAYFAVSVMKCSATTVNRSSRFSPSTILLVSGDWLTGLVQKTNMLLIGGSSFISPLSACAEPQIVDDARAGLDPVGPRGLDPVDREVPQRQLQHAAADVTPRSGECRKAVDGASGLCAAGAERSMATPMRIADGCEVANSRANLATSAALTPVTFST